MPCKLSLIKALKLEDFFRFSRQCFSAFREISTIPTIIGGKVLKVAKANFTFFANIITITATTVTSPGIKVVMLFSITSFREFTSPVIRAKIFPVGLESKKAKSKS